MKKDSDSQERTSRRTFTKSVVATLISAPIAASIVSCRKQGGQSETSRTTTPLTSGPKKTVCEPGVGGEEHIPPIDIGGGGSLSIELKSKLKTTDTTAPFTYMEDGIINPAEERFGDLAKVRVVTENATRPYVSVVDYFGLPPGSQLLLWYQNITPMPQDPDDTSYDLTTFSANDPDVRIVGGAGGANIFKMVLKVKKLKGEKSHKRVRPNRYSHEDGSGLGRHFRIGQWRIVDSNGTTIPGFEGSGAENYRFFLTFADFQP